MTRVADAELSDLWSGSYTADSNGHGTGIGLLRTTGDGTLRAVRTAAPAESPSFLVQHPFLPVVYAAQEAAQTVQTFTIVDAADVDATGVDATGVDAAGVNPAGYLEPLGAAWPAGAAVCHVTVDPDGRYAIATCWGDGTVHFYELDPAGAIVADHVAAPAIDPYADLPGGVITVPEAAPRISRAHASLVLPDGRVLTTDLGFDLARVWRVEPGVGLVADHEVTLPAGSGPRHPVLHPGGAVSIVTEYSIDVVTVALGPDGRYAITDVAPVFAGGPHPGDAAAHISLDARGQHVLVTVRGSNRVAMLAVRDDGARLEAVADVDCGGNWPRHHLQRGSFLYVANQLSDTIATFRLDASGLPSELLQTLQTGSPTCLIERR
ncbi:lactonase family protein [Rathayibacter soli]|uniref:lactonase family protein n=1 Tax=Rathayibacter soli TaxID=3144168 RepID=UPI0027E4CF4D|nr:beta-propeller fold lactonase family protein [Glaciibacter superstes]